MPTNGVISKTKPRRFNAENDLFLIQNTPIENFEKKQSYRIDTPRFADVFADKKGRVVEEHES